MADETQPALAVSIREVEPRTVACLMCRVDQTTGHFSSLIADGFEQVKQWAAQRGDVAVRQFVVGIPHVVERQLVAYECGVELLDDTVRLPPGWEVRQLPGGRYAVLTLEKDSATLGERIGEFFGSYIPQHRLSVDATRPSYEVYDVRTMAYHVPIE